MVSAVNETAQEQRDGIVLTEEQKKPAAPARSRLRSSLGALVILFYVITLVKGPGVLNRPL